MTDDLLTIAEPAPAKKITSSDIKIGLRNSLASGHQVFFEVGNDTGAKVSRHADAVAIGIWPSTGHQIHGYEIKVSRADFLNEMKQPEKSWPVMQFCHRWSLLTPPGLVRVDELPPNWGLSTYDGRSMRAVKHPPLLTPQPLSPGFVAALVRRAGEADAELITAAEKKLRTELEKSFRDRLDRELSSQREGRLRDADKAVKFFEAFKEALGESWLSEEEAPAMIEALKALRSVGVGRAYSHLFSVMQSMERQAASMRKALAEIGIHKGDEL